MIYYRYSQERKELIVMKRQPKKVYIEGGIIMESDCYGKNSWRRVVQRAITPFPKDSDSPKKRYWFKPCDEWFNS